MFGVSWLEMLVIAGVALVVIGPQDLPRVLYGAGKLARKARVLMSDIQQSIDGIMKDEELDEIIREANRPGGENLQRMVEEQLAAERGEAPQLPPEKPAAAPPDKGGEGA